MPWPDTYWPTYEDSVNARWQGSDVPSPLEKYDMAFNNWQPSQTPMEKVGDSGVWQTKLKLPQGRYRYRLVVDGQWQRDPYNEKTEMNPYGDFNSIVEVH